MRRFTANLCVQPTMRQRASVFHACAVGPTLAVNQAMASPMPKSAFIALSLPLSLVVGLPGCGDEPGSDAFAPNPSTDAGSEEDSGGSLPDGGCPSGTTECDGQCVDTNTDPEHCGSCGQACDPSEECHAGKCGTPCDEECTLEGEVECVGNAIRECGEFDNEDVCLEWGPTQECDEYEICDPVEKACRLPCGDHCDPFSIILLPDTQYYTKKQANGTNNTYYKQAQWIIDNRQSENIQFVIHLGDITNDNTVTQWEVADGAHALLDDADVPYSVVPGNHDYRVDGLFKRGGSLINDYFPPSRFEGKPWYGGSLNNSSANNFTLFEVGDMKFMVVSIEYAPPKDALCWAEEVVAAHPDRRVIIATHCYQTHGGGYSGSCPNPDYNTVGSSPLDIWDELVSRHSNIFLVVAGHVGDSEYRVRTGNAGNDVHEMLADYQFESYCTESDAEDCSNHCSAGTYTGNGWLRQLIFDPLRGSVHAETLTVEDGNASVFPAGNPTLFCSELNDPPAPATAHPWYSKDCTNADHRYDFDYDMTSPLTYIRDDGGKSAFSDRTVNSAGTGDQLAPRVAMGPDGSTVVVWEDDSSSADGTGNFDIKARGFGVGGCEEFSDIDVNSTTEGQQLAPDVAVDASGNFVVVWADDADDNGYFQIKARGFGVDGSERIPAFTVNSTAAGQQLNPAVAMAPDGRFVVAWEEGDEGSEQIFVRGFSANGAETFSDQSVHTDSEGQRIRPAIGMDASGGFVVAWQDDSDSNGAYQIHARGFEADGSERFPRTTVNSTAAGQQLNPALGMDVSGFFLVAWEDDQDKDGNYDILARGFEANGTSSLADFIAHDVEGGQHRYPSVSMAPAGSFALTWQDDGDLNDAYQIRAHTYEANGGEWLAEWTVNGNAAGQQLSPSIGLTDAGIIVVVWEDDMDGNDKYQILAAGLDSL